MAESEMEQLLKTIKQALPNSYYGNIFLEQNMIAMQRKMMSAKKGDLVYLVQEEEIILPGTCIGIIAPDTIRKEFITTKTTYTISRLLGTNLKGAGSTVTFSTNKYIIKQDSSCKIKEGQLTTDLAGIQILNQPLPKRTTDLDPAKDCFGKSLMVYFGDDAYKQIENHDEDSAKIYSQILE
jgi:hypothetical protein